MQYVFVLGGWDGLSCRSDVALYSPDGAPAGHLAPNARSMLSPRDALASAFVDHELVALGGHDGTNYLASCEIYTASTPGKGRFTTWTPLPAMSTTRAFHGAAHIKRTVAVFGGQGSQTGTAGGYGEAPQREASVLDTVEQLDLDSGRWTAGPRLPEPRTMLCGAVAGPRAFAIGGRDGKFDSGAVHSSAWAWDVREKEWQSIPPMQQPRFGCAAAAVGGCVYVFGGKDGKGVTLSSVERFEERMGVWVESAGMAHDRVFPQAIVMGSFIFVLAGHNRTNEVTEVEEWSHSTGRWRRVHQFKVHAIEDEIRRAEAEIQACYDDIYLCEKDVRLEEADKLRKLSLPLLKNNLTLAKVGKLSPWTGGPPRDSLLGMRHVSAQTVMPGSTVELLMERAREAEEAAAAKEEDSQPAARTASTRREVRPRT